jgi:hypothetical protein
LEHGPVGDEVGLHAFGLDGRWRRAPTDRFIDP